MTPEPRLLAPGWVPDPLDRGDASADASADASQPDPLDPLDRLLDDPGEPRPGSNGVRRHRPPWWRRLGRGGRFVETWVPEPLRDARIDPGRRGALILSLVAALAAVAAAIGVWRDRPEPRPVQTISHAAEPITTGAGGPSRPDESVSPTGAGGTAAATGPRTGSRASSTGVPAPAVLAVSVTGAVRRPGLVRVPNGSRVADAIAAAGGITTDADITGLNVATVLADGDSVVVGAAGAPTRSGTAGTQDSRGAAVGPPVGPTGTGASGPVDLNTADSAALEALPGVGPVMAGNIIAWRDANGPFTAVDQLQEISGIGPARYAQLSPLVVVG